MAASPGAADLVGDPGDADPRLAAALEAYDGSGPTRAEVLAALATARVFVAITAAATGQRTAPTTGLPAESGAELALVSIVSSDGERAVPAFADPAALRRWRLDVRPVPVGARDLARAACDDGAAAVLVDPGGAAVVIRRPELTALAEGYVPVPGAPLAVRRTDEEFTAPRGPVDPGFLAALATALRPERLRAARLLEGSGGPVLGVAPRAVLSAAGLTELAARVRARLGPAMPATGLDLAVVGPTGPGVPIAGAGGPAAASRRWRRR